MDSLVVPCAFLSPANSFIFAATFASDQSGSPYAHSVRFGPGEIQGLSSQGIIMNAYKSKIQLAAIILLIAAQSTETNAIEITKTITFNTSSSEGSLVSVQGKLNTLAQGLNVVPFGSTTTIVHGELTANVTFDVSQNLNDVEIVGFDIVGSSFVQQNLLLSYQVANTTRTVQFLTNNIGFSINSASTNQQLLQSGGINIPANSFQITQSCGTAQIDITNRPSKQQNLTQQSVLSNYFEVEPNVSQFAAAVTPINQALDGFVVDINIPLTNQQLIYAGVGLPVTLDYAGELNLLSPIINFGIPEPSSAILITSSCALLFRRKSTSKRNG